MLEKIEFKYSKENIQKQEEKDNEIGELMYHNGDHWKPEDMKYFKSCDAIQAMSRPPSKEENEKLFNALEDQAKEQSQKIMNGEYNRKNGNWLDKEEIFQGQINPKHQPMNDTMGRIQAWCEGEYESNSMAYSYKLAMGRSNNIQQTNIAINDYNIQKGYANLDFNNYPYIVIEGRFQAQNRYDPRYRYGERPICPEHDVSSDELGYCPICGKRVYRVAKGVHFENKKLSITPKRIQARLNRHDRPLEYNQEAGEEFYKDFQWNVKFWGPASKKATGTDSLGLHDPKNFQNHLQGVAYTIDPIISTQVTQEQVNFYGDQNPRQIVKVKKANPCECGCNVRVHEMKRGDIVCPVCGRLYGTAVKHSMPKKYSDAHIENEYLMGNENPNLEE